MKLDHNTLNAVLDIPTAVDQLTGLLKRIDLGEDPKAIKREAQEFLSHINPQILTLAEQKLLEAGLHTEDLRHLCSTHIEMLTNEVEKLKINLEPDHMLYIMIGEHNFILALVDELERLNLKVSKRFKFNKDNLETKKLEFIAGELIKSDSHHQREEKVLFPELESRGIYGPPNIMKLDHQEIRNWKYELKNLAIESGHISYNDFKRRLKMITEVLTLKLRDHIFKENNILYPTAYEVIPKDVWVRMKEECDKIGYCDFNIEEE